MTETRKNIYHIKALLREVGVTGAAAPIKFGQRVYAVVRPTLHIRNPISKERGGDQKGFIRPAAKSLILSQNNYQINIDHN